MIKLQPEYIRKDSVVPADLEEMIMKSRYLISKYNMTLNKAAQKSGIV